ncbi:hypothetical protein JCM11491_002781 [Sporobolomyces phaffii]
MSTNLSRRAIVRRAIVKRNVVEEWGKSLQSWVQDRPPVAVFVLAIVLAFLLAVVLLSLVWETVRKCRTSHRASQDRERAEWLQLPDGSSVLTQGRVPDPRGNYKPGTFIGPMSSLIRDARATTGGGSRYPDHPRYVPTQTGGEHGGFVEGAPAPYDPPLAFSAYQRRSTGSTSQWSEQTKVEPEVETGDAKVRAFQPVVLPEQRPGPLIFSAAVPSIPPPPPPHPSPLLSSQPAATNPVLPTPPPFVRPLGVGHTRQASSGGFQPKDLHLVNQASPRSSPPLPAVDEDRSSTPKPSPPTPCSSSLSGSSVPTLSAFPAPSGSSDAAAPAKSLATASSIFPPRVDLKRTGTWSSSISSWIPALSDKSAAKEEEEETTKLVDQALKDAR